MKRTILAILLTLVSSNAFAVTGPFTRKIAFTTDRDGNSEIYTANPNGSTLSRLTNNTATDTHASFSRDGKKIAFMSARDGNNEIYVMNANGTGQTRLTNNPANDSQPAWSPDGTKIVFLSARNGNNDIFSMNADGTFVSPLTNDPASDSDPSFSPSGDKIVFLSTRAGNSQVFTMSAIGTNEVRLTNTGLTEVHPRFSRDGQKITFARHVLGSAGFNLQVVVTNSDGTDASVLTALGANSNPEFSADDSRIFFNSNRDGNNEIYSMVSDGSGEVRLTNSASIDIAPSVQSVIEVERVGVYRPSTGQWILATENAQPMLTVSVTFAGQSGEIPVVGNWDGDTRTDLGFFRDGVFRLVLLKVVGGHIILQELAPISFGQAGDLPVAGDWNGDGKDDVGVYRPAALGRFLLRQPVQLGGLFPMTVITTITVEFGTTSDLPITGDWNGDGIETVGVYRPGDPGPFLLTNSNAGQLDAIFNFGNPNDLPLVGDWLGTGVDGVGLLSSTTQNMFLAIDTSGKPALIIPFGAPGDIPFGGSWFPQ
jgi:Tol biopolymer transport system component